MSYLENNLKTIKLRSTLGVFERSKFFFNLPGSLSESVESGRYDMALRDYKKGKYLLDSRPGQLLAVGSAKPPESAGGARGDVQQKRVFAKVWDAVEATMKDMQSRLTAQLREPRRSVGTARRGRRATRRSARRWRVPQGCRRQRRWLRPTEERHARRRKARELPARRVR